MEESTKKYFKIGKVSEMLGVNASTLRFWEKNFPQINPMKNKKGDRIYRLTDIELLKEIQYLTYSKGMRLSAVSKKVKKSPADTDVRKELTQELLNLKQKLLTIKEQLE